MDSIVRLPISSIIAAALICLGGGPAAAAPSGAKPKPAPKPASATTATAQPQAAAPKATAIPQTLNVVQLCRQREAQMARYNDAILARMVQSRTANEEDRKVIASQIEALTRMMDRAEASWANLSCASILYGKNEPAGR